MNGVIEDSRFSTMRVATRSRVCGLSGAGPRSARRGVRGAHVEKRMGHGSGEVAVWEASSVWGCLAPQG